MIGQAVVRAIYVSPTDSWCLKELWDPAHFVKFRWEAISYVKYILGPTKEVRVLRVSVLSTSILLDYGSQMSLKLHLSFCSMEGRIHTSERDWKKKVWWGCKWDEISMYSSPSFWYSGIYHHRLSLIYSGGPIPYHPSQYPNHIHLGEHRVIVHYHIFFYYDVAKAIMLDSIHGFGYHFRPLYIFICPLLIYLLILEYTNQKILYCTIILY